MNRDLPALGATELTMTLPLDDARHSKRPQLAPIHAVTAPDELPAVDTPIDSI
jgi:hypothetical protein